MLFHLHLQRIGEVNLIGQQNLNQKALSYEDKKKLYIYLSELKSRGQPMPEGIELPINQNEVGWNLDSNGYFIKNDGKHFEPREELEAFIKDDARLILLKSGRGGGKSSSAVQKVLHKVKNGERGAVMNPDFENFRTSTWPEFRDWIPWSMVVPKHRFRASPSWDPIKPFSIVFVNGAKVYCKGLKDPESARGANINFFWYDEGRRDPTGLGWKNAIALCRIGYKPQAFCTTTMAGLNHWTNTFFTDNPSEEFQKIVEELKKVGKDQKMFSIHKTSPERNKQNLDPMFYATLLTTYPSGYLRIRELEGEAADEGGSLGSRLWFAGKGLPTFPDWTVKVVRFWDLAATEQKILRGKKLNDPDETIGTLLGMDDEKDLFKKRFVIGDQVGGYWDWAKIKEMVVAVAIADIEKYGNIHIVFEQEPASGGKNQVAELKQHIKEELKKLGIVSGFVVDSLEAKKLGDRVLAAGTWFAEAQTVELDGQIIHEGQFYYVAGMWNEKFFTQLDTFNGTVHDDRVTSVTGARHYLAPIKKKWSTPKFLALSPQNPENKEPALSLH